MYYIIKEGIYIQGVFHITDDYDNAVTTCNQFAKNDIDDYHQWVVVKYRPTEIGDAANDRDWETPWI